MATEASNPSSAAAARLSRSFLWGAADGRVFGPDPRRSVELVARARRAYSP